MQLIYALAFLMVLAAIKAETYSTEHDDFDVDGVVADDAKLKTLVGCFLDTAPCTAASSQFKRDLPDVYETACNKCTVKQKIILRKFLAGLKAKLPAEHAAFVKKHDPDGKFSAVLEAAIA